MLKAILVDFDGTLVNTHAANIKAYREALLETNEVFSEETLINSVGRLAWRPMLEAVLPNAPQLHANIANRKREIYPSYFSMVSVNESLVTTLSALKPSTLIALVTAASKTSVTSLLEEKKLSYLFDIIISSDDVEKQKPSPDPFQRAASLLGVTSEECLIFEDSEIGLAAARAFGAQTWQIHWPGTL